MKGRKPKPTKLKILQGNPGRRPLDENEPEPEIAEECPDPPDNLDDTAKEEWRKVAPQLHAVGLLTNIDLSALATYCNAYSRWIEAEKKIKEDGLVINAPQSGHPMQNPYLSISNKAVEQIKAFLTEFGMTPASRTRVKTASLKKSEKKKGFASL